MSVPGDQASAYPATTLRAAYAACDPDQSLDPADPRCVDLTVARGGESLAARIAASIEWTDSGSFHRQLITGHRGSGKSTEIRRLHTILLEKGYYSVYFDAFDILDPADVEHVDVLLGVAQAVYAEINRTEIALDSKLLERLESWFSDTTVTHEYKVDVEAALKAEAGIEAKIPTLLRLFTSLTGQIKAGGASKREIRQKLEREMSVFLQRLNSLLEHVQERLAEQGWKGLVVMVDNLEKLPYQTLSSGETNHSLLFLRHAEQLKAPACHIIYTVPVSLIANANLGADYNALDTIPMIKLTERDGQSHCQAGRQALYSIVERRMDVATVFADTDHVWRLIKASGGVVRDLVRLVQFACIDAGMRHLDAVDGAAVDTALRRLGAEYDELLQEEFLVRLTEVATARYLPRDELSGRLLFHRLVLEYDSGERWHDLHPLVRSASRMSRRFLTSG